MSICIENVYVQSERQDLWIRENTIEEIGSGSSGRKEEADQLIDGSDQIALPTLMNGHSHAAMTLFRGVADDRPLQEWLEDYIWPLEEQLDQEKVYWGTRLGCLEMIRSGTTFLNEMYWEYDGVVQAISDSRIRGMVSGVLIDQFDEEQARQERDRNRKRFEQSKELPERVQFSLGPHSIYTVSPESLEWVAEYSRKHGIYTHIHLSETEWERNFCQENYGTTPVRFLDNMDFFHDRVVIAHGLWLDREEIEILGEHNVATVYNPLANLKLTSGDQFCYDQLREEGIQVCLGTDGPASNNNLNLLEEIKMASLIQKNRQQEAAALPASEAVNLATRRPAEVFGLNCGTLAEGKLADLMLVDVNTPSMSLSTIHDTDSHVAYTMSPASIDTVICDGNVVMKHGVIDGEEEVLKEARSIARELC